MRTHEHALISLVYAFGTSLAAGAPVGDYRLYVAAVLGENIDFSGCVLGVIIAWRAFAIHAMLGWQETWPGPRGYTLFGCG
ncbi:MAG TPA: hypothetical protein PKD53_06120 [Chloroflexaceae bacterium]|nr:hypothetical protein [Chloroflexaceae bacterium]